MEKILFILACGAMLALIAYCQSKKLTSISSSFYQPKIGYLFTLWCWAVGLYAGANMLGLSDGRGFQFLGFFALGGLAFVGAAPHFLDNEEVIHYVSAGVCALSAQVWMMLFVGWWTIIPCAITLLITTLNKSPRRTYWLEVESFVALYIVIACFVFR